MKKNIKDITTRARVRDIMSSPLVTIEDKKTVQDAVELMHEKSISTLVVVRGDKPMGLFTERDVTRLAAAKKDFKKMKMLKAMSKNLVSVAEDMPLRKASDVMNEHQIRKLLITKKGGTVIGIVTQTDIVQNLNHIYRTYKSIIYNPWLTIIIALLIIVLYIINILIFR